MSVCIIYSTWPDAIAARACARELIENRLAACVTVVPLAYSTFRWEGETQEAEEAVMLAKTDNAQAQNLRDALVAAHPYDLPCVLAIDVAPEASNAAFLQWAATATRPFS